MQFKEKKESHSMSPNFKVQPPTECLVIAQKLQEQSIGGQPARYAFESANGMYVEVDSKTFGSNNTGDTYCAQWSATSPF
jgi:hypothetical protein